MKLLLMALQANDNVTSTQISNEASFGFKMPF